MATQLCFDFDGAASAKSSLTKPVRHGLSDMIDAEVIWYLTPTSYSPLDLAPARIDAWEDALHYGQSADELAREYNELSLRLGTFSIVNDPHYTRLLTGDDVCRICHLAEQLMFANPCVA